MAELPRHRGAGAEDLRGAEPGSKRSWTGYVIAGVIAAALVLVIVLHLTGVVGAGAHGG